MYKKNKLIKIRWSINLIDKLDKIRLNIIINKII